MITDSEYALREADLSFSPNYEAKMPKFAKHRRIYEWLSSFANKSDVSVLEVGSRKVQIPREFQWDNFIPNCRYTGFDFHEGENVDVVGDAHELSKYFRPNSFNVVVSLAVFEHLAMPWLVAEEISDVLKIGGYAAIETHFSYSEHELPWHFFQFNSNGLQVLFNKQLGFELVDSGMSNPIVGRFSHCADQYLRGRPVGELYCHSSIIVRKIAERANDFSWHKVLGEVASQYPKSQPKI